MLIHGSFLYLQNPKMKLAPDFDKMLEAFTNNDFCEHESIKVKDEWISIFK